MTDPNLIHDFIQCTSATCSDKTTEHCAHNWCGAPRNHPMHSCYVAPKPAHIDTTAPEVEMKDETCKHNKSWLSPCPQCEAIDTLQEHIQKAADEVATWPDWKKGYKPSPIDTTKGNNYAQRNSNSETDRSDEVISEEKEGRGGMEQSRDLERTKERYSEINSPIDTTGQEKCLTCDKPKEECEWWNCVVPSGHSFAPASIATTQGDEEMRPESQIGAQFGLSVKQTDAFLATLLTHGFELTQPKPAPQADKEEVTNEVVSLARGLSSCAQTAVITDRTLADMVHPPSVEIPKPVPQAEAQESLPAEPKELNGTEEITWDMLWIDRKKWIDYSRTVVEAWNAQQAKIEALEQRSSLSRLDNSHPVVHCLRLLADFQISVGKSCEFITHYIQSGIQDPIADEATPYDTILDDISANELAKEYRVAEAKISALEQQILLIQSNSATQAETIPTCDECEGPMEWNLRCAHCGANPSRPMSEFDDQWKALLEEGYEVEPSPEEEGFARWAWNACKSYYEKKIAEINANASANYAAAENRTHKLEKALKDILHHQSIVLGKLGTGGAPMNMSITAAIAIKALEPEEKLREGK